ncbi:hypothetical protein A1O1_05281 [Capronia coronata CBS 617.96]|uniref:DUF3669 domain-containing protein n=1 Tax=Capronia coronata CBS 617.96 TaxID=1182541 RepID=W9YGI6_9EURO|nr:uncharacterized protein A1O1_05281 [Capronia coronata CBS 617.96]EXJ88351.1 hypothetical protein A1O1_05281 [Capronia coronata CBS 617.96]
MIGASERQQYSSEEFLHHMLSTNCYMSMPPSLADKTSDRTPFTQVGRVTNKGKEHQLYNDHCQHALVEEALQETFMKYRRNINLPRLGAWIGPRNERFWNEYGNRFPPATQPARHSILSERILPLPTAIRGALVDVFGLENIKRNKASFLSQPEQKDCLSRIYVGRRQPRSATNTFRLRNFDMTVNEMELLRLPTELYAQTMAETLAVIHWKAKLDANDVEFVLGRAPQVGMRASAAEIAASTEQDVESLSIKIDFYQRSIGIWLLDFDQCKSFTQDGNEIKQLERAFYFNDPYYPRPISTDPKDMGLWKLFKDTYLTTSAAFTTSTMLEQFIAAVEAEGGKRKAGGSLFG